MTREPDGWALRNDQGYWVGIWNDRGIAEDLKQRGQHNDCVTPLYAHPPHEAVSEEWILAALDFLDRARKVFACRFPRCRDCADHDGECPSSGLPCEWPDTNVIRTALRESGTVSSDGVLVPRDGWIPVSERLPDKQDFRPRDPTDPTTLGKRVKVLAATSKGRVYETMYTELGWANLASRDENVTHWQPLPEPPMLAAHEGRSHE